MASSKDEKTPKKKQLNTYSASSIQVLEGREAVRKRPGMYIGGVGIKGLHHLVSEVVDNAVDEAIAGYCTEVNVTIGIDNDITIKDNGRGIPWDTHKGENLAALEVVMTTLHAGGKFNKDSYNVTGGLHGVGVSCVNFLSNYLTATTHKDGQIYQQSYKKGIRTSDLKHLGTTDKHGTTIHFKPDGTIFDTTIFQYNIIATRLRELSFLNPKLKLTLTDMRTKDEEGLPKTDIFYSEEGLKDFIRYLDANRDSLLPAPIHVTKQIVTENKATQTQERTEVEIALSYNTGHSEHIISYANSINTFEGGTHLAGLKRGLTRAMKAYGEKNKIFEKAKITPSGDDFREGATIVISVKLSNPQFSGQEKARLTNVNVGPLVENGIKESFSEYLEEHPKQAKTIMDKVILAARARQAAKKARDLIQRKSPLGTSSTLPGKLTDCSSKDATICELFLLEGVSAAGTVKGGRRRDIQAVLPLRGKILNIEKAQEHKIYESQEIANIITALGVYFQDTDEGRVTKIDKLRYHKIIIMTDADVDGSHIRTLILTLFFRHMPELIQKGYIYIALPPLYLVKKGNHHERYCWDEAQLQTAKEELSTLKAKGDIVVQRYKGLGEMNEDQIWDTTLNPENRILEQVTIESALEADRLFSILMGDSIPPRRALIEKHAKDVDIADIL